MKRKSLERIVWSDRFFDWEDSHPISFCDYSELVYMARAFLKAYPDTPSFVTVNWLINDFQSRIIDKGCINE